MHKVKIVFFIDVLKKDFDGVTNTMHQIVSRIPIEKVDAIFITSQPPDNPDFPFRVFHCPFIELPGYREYPFALPQFMRGLKRTLDDFEPDLIHWSTPSALGWYAVRYASKRGIPIVSIYHTHFTSYVEGFLKFLPGLRYLSLPVAKRMLSLYRKCSLVLAPTNSMQQYVQKLGVDSARIRIWGRGINTTIFHPVRKSATAFQSYGIEDQKKILFVSRLVRYKETDTLIEFYRRMNPEWKLIITGNGPDEERMKRLMPNAIFTGKLTGDRLSEVYASADVFVFPSITETFGNVVLEAMASGLPVVAARAGGPADIIQDGSTGFLVEPKNADQLYEKVSSLLADADLYNSVRENALAYASLQNWDVLCQVLMDYYFELAGEEK